MFFTCDACRYTFSAEAYKMFPAIGTVSRCPDCGKIAVRPATKAEITSYERVRKEIEEEDRMVQLSAASLIAQQ